MNRLRTNVAWWLRGIAKWFNARAERIEPIKLSTAAAKSRLYVASKAIADDIIERARRTHA